MFPSCHIVVGIALEDFFVRGVEAHLADRHLLNSLHIGYEVNPAI